jgi:tetratricopeptide (TPR) repeat protein
MRRFILTCTLILAAGCSNRTPESPSHPLPAAAEQSSRAPASVNSLESSELPAKPPVAESEIVAIKQQATSLIESLAEQFPHDADALEAKARFYLMLGDLGVSQSCWERAIVVAPDYGYAYQGLGSIAIRNSDYPLAAQHLTKAVEMMPGNSLASHELSDALLKNGELDKAIEVLENQLKVGPQLSDTWQLLGQARIADRQYVSAGQAFEKSLALAPQNQLAKQGIGSVLVRLGKSEEAQKWLKEQELARATQNLSNQQALEAERYQFATRLELAARVWLKHGRLSEALEVVQYCMRCSANHEGSRLLASTIWQQLNKPTQALEVLRELTAVAPENPSYWMKQGSLGLQLQDWKTADESFQKIIELVPDSPDGYAALAQTLIISGLDRGRAIEMAHRVTQLRGTASDFATYSQSLAISGRIAESIQAMQTAISKDPQSPNYKALLEQLLQAEVTR